MLRGMSKLDSQSSDWKLVRKSKPSS